MDELIAEGIGSSVRPRRARGDDLDALERLEVLCFDETMRFSRASLARRLNSRHEEVWVVDGLPEGPPRRRGGDARTPPANAAVPGPIVAALILRPYRRVVRVESLAVAPHVRQVGLGTALLALAGDRALRRGAERLVLEVSVAEDVAVEWYHRRGFVVVRRLPDQYGPRRHGLRMERLLRGGGAGDPS